MYTGCLGTWFSGARVSVGFKFGLGGLTGLFQPKLFYDSTSWLLWICLLTDLGGWQQDHGGEQPAVDGTQVRGYLSKLSL